MGSIITPSQLLLQITGLPPTFHNREVTTAQENPNEARRVEKDV